MRRLQTKLSQVIGAELTGAKEECLLLKASGGVIQSRKLHRVLQTCLVRLRSLSLKNLQRNGESAGDEKPLAALFLFEQRSNNDLGLEHLAELLLL